MKQQSKEWFGIRAGKLTASHGQEIGNHGAGLKTVVEKTVSEKFMKGNAERFFNKHTDRGNELEPQAVTIYELENGVEIENVGIITNEKISKVASCSPDGLVKGKKGGLEIKCFDNTKHFLQMIRDEITVESKYEWQVQMSLLITGYDWWDYALFNPNYEKSLLVKRIYPDLEKFEKLKIGLKMGEEWIKELEKKYYKKFKK